MRVTAADLERLRASAAARAEVDLSRGKVPRLPAAAGGGRGRLTTPARTPQVGGPATLRCLRRAAAPRERDLQREILVFLNAQPGFHAWKAGAGLLPLAGGRRVRMGKAGVSDAIGWLVMHMIGGLGEMRWCRRPKGCYFAGHVPVWIAVECKRPGSKPTPAQLDFLARLREAGSPLALVATSVDQVRRAVEAL